MVYVYVLYRNTCRITTFRYVYIDTYEHLRTYIGSVCIHTYGVYVYIDIPAHGLHIYICDACVCVMCIYICMHIRKYTIYTYLHKYMVYLHKYMHTLIYLYMVHVYILYMYTRHVINTHTRSLSWSTHSKTLFIPHEKVWTSPHLDHCT